MVPTAMGDLLALLSQVVTTVAGFITGIVAAVIAQPILLIPIGIGLLGTGVALVKKFM